MNKQLWIDIQNYGIKEGEMSDPIQKGRWAVLGLIGSTVVAWLIICGIVFVLTLISF